MTALRTLAWPALAALLYAVPAITSDPYVLHVLVLATLWTIPAIGLNLMMGYTGLVSLGHMGFAGAGAYVGAVLMVDAKLGFWWSALAGALGAGMLGAAVGAICLRFRTHFFMIVTLAFGLLLFSVFNNWDDVTRGAVGFPGIPRPPAITVGETMVRFGPLPNFYRLALTCALAMLVVQWLLVRSDFGRVLMAIRQDERLAQARGVNAAAYKIAAFALGSAIAGFGGVLTVSFLRVAAPASFNLAESINAVLIVVLGGAGSLAGPALGALVFVALPEYLRMAAEWRLVVFGTLLVLAMRFAPDGLAGLARAAAGALRRRRGT